MTQVRRSSILAGVVSASLLFASGLTAQTTVFSTFGSGNSYLPVEQSIFDVGAGAANWLASSFVYSGPSGVSLSSISFAGQDQGQFAGLTVNFLDGLTMGTATSLESWSLPSNSAPDQINNLPSVLMPTLVSGDTYWVELSTYYEWGWNYNDAGFLGFDNSLDGGATWNSFPQNLSPAFSVAVNSAVVPEPATMSLMALGLVGLAANRRRKRSS